MGLNHEGAVFSSPFGEWLLSTVIEQPITTYSKRSSRPLSGNGCYQHWSRILWVYRTRFLVPFRGMVVINPECAEINENYGARFSSPFGEWLLSTGKSVQGYRRSQFSVLVPFRGMVVINKMYEMWYRRFHKGFSSPFGEWLLSTGMMLTCSL